MGTSPREFMVALIANHRVLVIGGLAVIAHGFNRHTKDAEVWLEPMNSPEEWAAALEQTCARFPNFTIHTLPGWRAVSSSEVSGAATEVGRGEAFVGSIFGLGGLCRVTGESIAGGEGSRAGMPA